jgi:hypothetical protein
MHHEIKSYGERGDKAPHINIYELLELREQPVTLP